MGRSNISCVQVEGYEMAGQGQSRRARKRAVRLSADGIKLLQEGLQARWQAEFGDRRPTRAALADLLGVSITTAERILTGQGVDRATILLAFRSVELAFDEEFLEKDRSEPPVDTPLQIERPPIDAGTLAQRPKIKPLNVGIGILCFALAAIAVFNRSSLPDVVTEPWMNDYKQQFDDAERLYHAGSYSSAREKIKSAIHLARTHDSMGRLATCLVVAGELEVESGAFASARARFEEAITLRSVSKKEGDIVAIRESLGDLLTKMGEYPRAEQELRLAYAGFRRLRDSGGMAMSLRELGTLEYSQKRWAAAERYFQQALGCISAERSPDRAADLGARRALVWNQMGRREEAAQTLRVYLQYWSDKGHPRWIATTQFQLGTVLADMGKSSEAIPILRQSELGFKAVSDREGQTKVQLALQKMVSSRSQ